MESSRVQFLKNFNLLCGKQSLAQSANVALWSLMFAGNLYIVKGYGKLLFTIKNAIAIDFYGQNSIWSRQKILLSFFFSFLPKNRWTYLEIPEKVSISCMIFGYMKQKWSWPITLNLTLFVVDLHVRPKDVYSNLFLGKYLEIARKVRVRSPLSVKDFGSLLS